MKYMLKIPGRAPFTTVHQFWTFQVHKYHVNVIYRKGDEVLTCCFKILISSYILLSISVNHHCMSHWTFLLSFGFRVILAHQNILLSSFPNPENLVLILIIQDMLSGILIKTCIHSWLSLILTDNKAQIETTMN